MSPERTISGIYVYRGSWFLLGAASDVLHGRQILAVPVPGFRLTTGERVSISLLRAPFIVEMGLGGKSLTAKNPCVSGRKTCCQSFPDHSSE